MGYKLWLHWELVLVGQPVNPHLVPLKHVLPGDSIHDTMRVAISTIDAVGKAAGAGKEGDGLPADRQIKTVSTLALLAKDEGGIRESAHSTSDVWLAMHRWSRTSASRGRETHRGGHPEAHVGSLQ